MKKFLLTLGTVGTIALPIAATVSCDSDKIGDKDIAMVVSTKNNPFFVTLTDSAKKEAEKHGYKLHTFVSNDDQSIEADKIDIIISQGFKTLIFNGLDKDQSAAAAKKAIDAGIKVIVVDRILAPSAGQLWTTISSANKDGAKRLADKTLDLFKNYKIELLEMLHLQGISGEQNGVDRWDGVKKEAIDKQNYVTISNILHARANYDRSQGQTQTATKMTSNPSIKWINADNDEMALGAIASLGPKAGKNPINKIIVTGFDGSSDAIDAIKNDKMFGTVQQDAVGLGVKAVNAAIEAAGGKDFPDIEKGKEILVPVNVITKANVFDFD